MAFFANAALLAFSNISSARAAPAPVLELPVDRTPGKNRITRNYFDGDPGAEAFDDICGRLTYGNHRRVDVRIANLAVMERGVAVLSAAPGLVRERHDGGDRIVALRVDRLVSVR